MATYFQLDANDQLTGRKKNIDGTPPTKADLAPGKPYWLVAEFVDTNNAVTEYTVAEPPTFTVDLPNQKVVVEQVTRDMTQQEKDDTANGIFNRLTQQDKASAAILLTMRDLLMEVFQITQSQANTQLRNKFRDYYNSL